MLKRYYFLLFLFCSLGAYCQNTLTFNPSKDTYINTVIADQVQGQTQSFIAAAWTYGGAYGQGRSLMGFELCELPEDFVLVSATLHLYHDYSGSHVGHTTNGLNDAKLYKITSPWDESTTWSSQPSYDPNLFSVLPSSTVDNQAYSIDLTGIVSNCLNTSPEIGFYFRLDDEQIYRSFVFASSDHPDPSVHPQLDITYYTDSSWCGAPPAPDDGTPIDTTIVTPTDPCQFSVKVPNVFTPNDDLVNDFFKIKTTCVPSSFQVTILNRWGAVVFTSSDHNFEWGGSDQNNQKALSEGTYFYKITYTDQQDSDVKSGFVELVR
ncbi:MAG: hypothetical protein Crog4KO_34410 [Crocinitomicaceae bacterium]